MPTTPVRQPRQSIETRRRQVLDAALELIVQDGYAAASMEAIARRVGVAKPVVYHAYGDRGALLQALLEREERRALSMIAAALPDDEDGDGTDDDTDQERLAFWAEHLARAVVASPDTWRLMLLPVHGTPQIVRDHVAAGRELVATQVVALLTPMIDDDALDLELAAQTIVAAAERAGALLLERPDEYTPERLVAFVRQAMALLI